MKAYHPPAVQALKEPNDAKKVKWVQDALETAMMAFS